MPLALLTAALLLQPGPPEPAVIVHNSAAQPLRQLVRVSVPWPRGALADVRRVRLGDTEGSAVPLVRWPDGSVAVAQVRATLALGPLETVRLAVEPRRAAETAPDADFDALERILRAALRTELVDPFGRIYHARFEARDDPAAAAQSDARVRIVRFRSAHVRAAEPVPEAFLGLEGFAVLVPEERRIELTVILSNDPAPGEPVFGPVRFTSFALLVEDPDLRVLPRFRAAFALPPPKALEGGGFRQPLLGPDELLYLGDRTGKAFRFDLVLDGPDVDAGTRARVRAAVETPFAAFADLDWVRHTGAFALHGGPAPSPADPIDHGRGTVERWRRTAVLHGPFAAFGVPKDPASAVLWPGPSALHNVLRWRSRALLHLAEAALLQETLRPAPAAAPRVPEDTAAFRSGLGPAGIAAPHGFVALDYEHFSVDLLYDFYWLTGDPLARALLARVGRALLREMDGVPFPTSRGEGLGLRAGVAIARATSDRVLVDNLLDRFRRRVLPALRAPDGACLLAQPPHPDALGPVHTFEATWQMAALIHGLHALWTETGAPDLAEAATCVARTIATRGFVAGVGPKTVFGARDPNVFRLPVDHRPDEGTAWAVLSAFVLAEEMAAAASDRELFRSRILQIAGERLGAPDEEVAQNPWFQLLLDRERG